MTITAGIDVGSTYTKAALLVDGERLEAKAMNRTGFRLAEVAERTFGEACAAAGIAPEEVDSVASTGYGRHQVA
ncbi:MAG: 2-hydroxyglutaryl-CoA dehydratase, partial [Actinomycetia bacterium]|nr:2-hydroxyglutaryl-CoA dehydratase [Actinomycetes bacterium]